MNTNLSITSCQPAPMPAGLTPSLQSAAVAYLNDEPTALQLHPNELAAQLAPILTGAAQILGHRNTLISDDDLLLLAQTTAAMVQRSFGAFKVSELSQAVQRGITREYITEENEVIAVGAASLAKWFRAYQSKHRAKVVQAIQKERDAADKPLLAEGHPDRVEWRVKALLQLRDAVKADKAPAAWQFDPGNALYEWVKAVGLLRNFRTAAQYEAMWVEESDKILAGVDMADREARKQANAFAAFLDAMEIPADHPMAINATNACKKRVLREWLEDMILVSADLDTILRDAAAVYYDSHPEAA